jgi:NADH dehydrogenase
MFSGMNRTAAGAKTPVPSTKLPHVVIIGGGFAGIQAAKQLKHAPVRITLIDRNNYHLFQPLLYQVATAYLSPGDIAYPIRSILRNQPNVSVQMTTAETIDLPNHRVTTTHGPLDYDYLIIAAGARSTWFGHDAWRTHAPALKSVEQALDMRQRVLAAFERAELETDPAKRRADLTFVVVGGGPTGVELAGALAELSRQSLRREFRRIDPGTARIILVESGQRLLDTYPERLTRAATRSLEQLGVEVRTGVRVQDVRKHSVRIGDENVSASTVLWAAGVEAETLGGTLGLTLLPGKRVPAQADLSLEGYPHVFVTGDINGTLDKHGHVYPGVAQVAMQQGRLAAKNIRRQIKGEPTRVFHYKDKGAMATIGRNRAIAQIGPVQLSGFPAWAIWALIHIVSLIGFRSRIAVFWTWMWSYLTSGRSSRLITGHQAPLMLVQPESRTERETNAAD